MAFRKRTVALLDDLRIIPLRRARGAHPATFPGAGRAVGNVRRMVVQAGQRWTRTKSRLRRQRTASRHECVRTQLQSPGWVRPALPSSFFTMSNSPLRGSRRAAPLVPVAHVCVSGSLFPFASTPIEGWAERRQAHTVCCRVCQTRPSALVRRGASSRAPKFGEALHARLRPSSHGAQEQMIGGLSQVSGPT